jgi:hypothetical protein
LGTWDCVSNTEFGIDQNNTRPQSRYAFWERHVGGRQRRFTLTKQRCMGHARQPMKVSKSTNFVPIVGPLVCGFGLGLFEPKSLLRLLADNAAD